MAIDGEQNEANSNGAEKASVVVDGMKNPRWPLRGSLFEPKTVEKLQTEYGESKPYRHLVMPDLMDHEMLKGACEELKSNMQATLKETDIFKVYQTGDLANMDGLPQESKRLLPSLFAIRNALYSLEFRRLVQSLTGSGPLSGEQIDLSVNAFGHTGHLLCHDDVIGTRKVSYILYLVDEDWGTGEKPDGGGLQLYPLERDDVPGIPAYAPSKTIPPRWNQMVLFAVQPGRSFHDVQEVYNEKTPRLAVSGWFHGAMESEMAGWPEHTLSKADGDSLETANEGASTLEQLKGKRAANGGSEEDGKDDGSPGAFVNDFVGGEDLEEMAQWVNHEYLVPSMVDQCAEAFNDNGSTIQLHRFLKDDVAQKIVDAVIAADNKDGLGYMEASPFDVGVRGGWRKAGPPHRQRLLRLSVNNPGQAKGAEDDEIGLLLRDLRDKLFRSRAFKALLEKLVVSPVVASRRQARRFRPGLDYTLATPGAPWEFKGAVDNAVDGQTSPLPGSNGDGGELGVVSGQEAQATEQTKMLDGETKEADREVEEGDGVEEKVEYMVLDAVLSFVDDREPYKEAAWRQDEVGGYVTYLAGDEDEVGDQDGEDVSNDAGNGSARGGNGPTLGEVGEIGSSKGLAGPRGNKGVERNNVGVKGMGTREGRENDAAVYKADEGGMLVSVSAASNALSLVLRDDEGIVSFVKYVSSAAPGSRFDVGGEYLVLGGADSDSESEGDDGVVRGVLRRESAPLEAVLEEEEDEDEEEEDEDEEEEDEANGEQRRKKLRAS